MIARRPRPARSQWTQRSEAKVGVKGRRQRAYPKVGHKGRTQRSDPKVRPKGQTQRSDSKVRPKGRTQRSDSKVRLKGQTQRSDPKVGLKGQTLVSNTFAVDSAAGGCQNLGGSHPPNARFSEAPASRRGRNTAAPGDRRAAQRSRVSGPAGGIGRGGAGASG